MLNFDPAVRRKKAALFGMTIIAFLAVGSVDRLIQSTRPAEPAPITVTEEHRPVTHHNNGAYYPDEQPAPPALPPPPPPSTLPGALIRFVLRILQVVLVSVYLLACAWRIRRPEPKYQGYQPLGGIGIEI